MPWMADPHVPQVRTCVFLCAGFGTRFLPATKVVPKELLPLVDKPALQYSVEEAVGAGLAKMVVVTSRGKGAILDHFHPTLELEAFLREKGKTELLEEVQRVNHLADVISVRQQEPLGIGHAVLMARGAIGDEPFAVVLPDDVIAAERPCLAQMLEVYEETGAPVVALMEVSEEETRRYGIVAGELLDRGRFRVTDMVEKPKDDPPSRYAIIGRYILPPRVFAILERTEKGAGGEIQLTDALRVLAREGPFYGLVFEGTRYDAGEKLGYLKATVDFALHHPTLGPEFRKFLRERVR